MNQSDFVLPSYDVAIIGAGLSGLYTAYLLEKYGIRNYVLIDSRDRLGGRIYGEKSHSDAKESGSIDLGPTWYWPTMQAQLATVIKQLGLESFKQYDQGDMLYERSVTGLATRVPEYSNESTTMRVVGGMTKLVDALADGLISVHLRLNHSVSSIYHGEYNHRIECKVKDGAEKAIVEAKHIFLALPPRIVGEQIRFDPALPGALTRQWCDTETWMAPHAKYVAVYDSSFWREKGLSGQVRSRCGPMVEIHDASQAEGVIALFGFIGVPASVRKTLSEQKLKEACRQQLVRLFGSQAQHPQAEYIKDWAQDRYTATFKDLESSGQHINQVPAPSAQEGLWKSRLVGVASEWSPSFPGYLAGAVEAAERGVQALLQQNR